MRSPHCLALLLLPSLWTASAQQAASGPAGPGQPPSWSRVEALPPGTGIHVKAKSHSANCNFTSASETEMACAVSGGAPLSFPRAEIKAVQVRHRGRSALAGLAIGAGGGAAVGAPFGQSGSFVGHGAAATIFAVPLGVIGAVVGVSTDFTHSTVYRAQ